ncbi:MAG: branched-chain amino acid ABC transporter permease [Rhizobiaceae bacterium]
MPVNLRLAGWFTGVPVVVLILSTLSSAYALSLLTTIGINTIAAIGMSLIFGQTRQLNLGQAAFFGLGGYAAGFLAVKANLPPLAGLAAATAVPALIALPIGWAVLRLSGFYLAMATLALNSIMFTLFSQYEGGPPGVTGIPGIPPISLGPIGFYTANASATFIWLVALAALAFSDNLLNSKVGRALRAIRESEVAAMVTGIPVVRYKMIIFALGASLSGLAGALSAHYNGFIGADSASLQLSIFLLVAVVVGGRDSIWGAPIGVASLILIVEGVSAYGRYDILAYGVLLTMVLILAPQGLTGLFAELYQKMAPTARKTHAQVADRH